VVGPVGEPDPLERRQRAPPPLARRDLGVDQRQLDVLERAVPGQQVKLLEDEAQLLVPQPRELGLAPASSRTLAPPHLSPDRPS
jgi:hypothetical protein